MIENNLVEEPKIRITPPTIHVKLLADYIYVTTPYNPKYSLKATLKDEKGTTTYNYVH
jgi:hypothetical protein